jgi:hypothetical protein
MTGNRLISFNADAELRMFAPLQRLVRAQAAEIFGKQVKSPAAKLE